MRFVITPRARRQVERELQWWRAHRENSPGLFVQELTEAERHLATLPGSGEPWRIRKKKTIRRWLLEKTGQHLYYWYDAQNDALIVLALWGARRGRTPVL